MSGPRREHITQSSFPNLQIMPIGVLLPHEEHDTQRAEPLIERIRTATTWLNPPVVAPINGSSHFVVLDGANRHYALQALGYEHILVQVVEYDREAVVLETWHHAVRNLAIDDYLPPINAIGGVSVHETSLLDARAALASRAILCYTVLRDSRVFALHHDTPHISRTTMLRRVVDVYKYRGRMNRVTHDEIGTAREMYPDLLGIVVFPRYEPAEIMVAARDDDLLPPGITRHIIYGRALRLNYPLAELQHKGLPLEEKNARLAEWVRQRLSAKHIRFYAEPTFLFDE
jgi:hypothetical protein